jgi:acetate kinase
MPPAILAINAGSSSIKFAVYAMVGSELELLCRGMLDRHAGDTHFGIKNAKGEVLPEADPKVGLEQAVTEVGGSGLGQP